MKIVLQKIVNTRECSSATTNGYTLKLDFIYPLPQLNSFRLQIIAALSNVLDNPPASLPDLFYFSVRTFFTSEATMARTVTIATMKKGRAP